MVIEGLGMAHPARSFASTDDLAPKQQTVEELAPGVFACTAEGDPNLGAIVGEHAVLAIDARATPTATQPWVDELHRLTGKPVRYLVMTHYHAVRALGASALRPAEILASRTTRQLVLERGTADWESEFRRMPRLAQDPDSVPGLTVPTVTFSGLLEVDLGGRTVEIRQVGRGHTAGDVVVWLPQERVLFAGGLVESEAACYMGDAHVDEWRKGTLDSVDALGAATLVPGRGAVVHGPAVAEAVASTRAFLDATWDAVAGSAGGLRDAFAAAHAEMAPRFGNWPIFEHCLPFNVKRVLDERAGRDPAVWTAAEDQAIWTSVHG